MTLEFLPELARAMGRMTDLAGRADGTEDVVGCPGWTTTDLVVHLGTMHRWSAAIVLSGQSLHTPRVLAYDPIAEWYAGTATALLTALQAVVPDESTPNFSGVNETAGFWPRRQMHETTVHAVDLAQAMGIEEAEWRPEADVAADGVDEVLEIFFPRMVARGLSPVVTEPIALLATDTRDRWVIAPQTDSTLPPTVSRDPLEFAGATITGLAADLYLSLWHRVDAGRLEVSGEAARLLLAGPLTP
ncbi:maleylpyruvate isomerase family mycothiol-dependent enzyme [soil metagenome]